MATTTNALSDAIKSFQDCLKPEQKVELEAIKAVPDVHAVAKFTHQLDEANATRNSRCVAARISPLLESIQQFSGVVETFVSSHPQIAALIWGSVKFALQIASNFTSYFDRLSALLMAIGKRCPRFQAYQKLYGASPDLQKALCEFYAVVVRCCEKVVRTDHHTGRNTPTGGYTQVIKALSGSYRSEFDSLLNQVDKASDEVKEAIHMAEADLGSTERQLQQSERAAAGQYRLDAMAYHRQQENAEAQRTTQTQLDVQRIRHSSLLDELSSYDYKTALWRARTQRHGPTGQWLTRTHQFAEWLDGNNPAVFWCSGKLGSGKTVLTGYAIEHLSARYSQSSHKVAYFFCQHEIAISLQAGTILRSLIRQCLDQDTSILTAHESKLKALLKTDPDGVGELADLLFDITVSLSRVIIIIDGLDECNDKETKLILTNLRKIMLRKPPGLKLCLSGDDRITHLIRSCLSPAHTTNTQCPDAQADLEELIRQLVFATQTDGDLVVGDDHLIQEIINALIKGAQGMILWVKFQLKDICSQKTDESIRETVQNLPKDLFATYNRLLSRIVEDGSERICAKMFCWIATTRRPLGLEELREAIAIKPCQPYSKPGQMVNNLNGMTQWCHGLVTVDELEEVMQFVHSSVKEFLCSVNTQEVTRQGFHFDLRDEDLNIGHICVTYLNFSNFKEQKVQHQTPTSRVVSVDEREQAPDSSLQLLSNLAANVSTRNHSPFSLTTSRSLYKGDVSNSTTHPFLEYALSYWLDHSKNISPNTPAIWNLFTSLVLGMFGSDQNFGIETLWLPKPVLGDLSLIGYTLLHQHTAIMILLKQDSVVWSRKDLNRILVEALKNDRASFVEPLLRSRAYPIRSNWMRDVLFVGDNLDLVEALILSSDEWTHDLTAEELSMCLECMIIHNSSDGVSRAIDAGAQVDTFSCSWQNTAAVNDGAQQLHDRTDRKPRFFKGLRSFGSILRRGLSLMANPEPTHHYLSRGHHGLRQLLPVELAIRLGRADIVNMLRGRGAYLDAGPHNARYPLHQAVQYGDVLIAKKLLDLGADIGTSGMSDDNVLHIAAQRSGKRIWSTTKLSPDDGFPSRAPWLDSSMKQGLVLWDHRPMITMLLEEAKTRGVNLNVKNQSGKLPLEYITISDARLELDRALQEARAGHPENWTREPLVVRLPSARSMI
ncbi:hypothetical protein KCU67_g2421, partial [Aureobasidium melanogenum]